MRRMSWALWSLLQALKLWQSMETIKRIRRRSRRAGRRRERTSKTWNGSWRWTSIESHSMPCLNGSALTPKLASRLRSPANVCRRKAQTLSPLPPLLPNGSSSLSSCSVAFRSSCGSVQCSVSSPMESKPRRQTYRRRTMCAYLSTPSCVPLSVYQNRRTGLDLYLLFINSIVKPL